MRDVVYLDQILVQLPGVTDIDRAKQVMGSPGLLELKIVEQGPVATRESLLVNGQVPAGMEIVPGVSGVPGDPSSTVYYLLRRAAAVSGRDLRNARPTIDENNQPAVSFTLNTEGGTVARLEDGRVHLDGFRWKGPDSELNARGALGLIDGADGTLQLDGDASLGLLTLFVSVLTLTAMFFRLSPWTA